MKLQKQLSRKVKDKEYPKYVLTVPPKQIQQLKWKEGLELQSKVDGERLIIEPK